MASDEPTGGNIQHAAPAEHNTSAVPGAAIVDTDGAVVANEHAMLITAIDDRRPVSFVSRGLASWSDHSAPLGMHRVSPYPTAPTTTAVNNLAVHRIMERMGYSAGHDLGLHHQGDANLI